MKHYLFTYGMLTNRDIMDPTAKLVGAARAPGWQFEMLTFANVRPWPAVSAHGVLWEIDDDILKSCDYREGYPHLYDRVLTSVYVGDREYRAWVYTLTRSGRDDYACHRASEYYVDSVLEGYIQHGVDLDQLRASVLVD